MYRKLKDLAYKLWNSEGRKVFHTFWQAAGGVLIAGLLAARSSQDVKAVVAVAVAAGLAAVKAAVVARLKQIAPQG